jgi:hypothetical protein
MDARSLTRWWLPLRFAPIAASSGSEDMHDGLVVDGRLRIANPFR